MTLGKVKNNSCATSKLPIIKKNCLVIIELVADRFVLYVVNKHQCNRSMFTMHGLFNKFLTVTGNTNTMYSKNRIGNRKFHSKLPIIVFQINSVSLIQSIEFRETSIEY